MIFYKNATNKVNYKSDEVQNKNLLHIINIKLI